MLYRLLPSEPHVHNPVFNAERTLLGSSYDRATLRRHARLMLIGVVALTIVLWRLQSPASGLLFHQSHSLNWLIAVSILVTLLASINAVVMAVRVVEEAQSSRRLENLRVTDIGGQRVVEAYITIARMRAWNLSLVEVALRFGIALLFLLNWFAGLTRSPLGPGSPHFLETFGVAFALIFAILALFVVEPFARLHLMVTMAVAASLRAANLSMLVSVGLAILVHLMQAFALFLIWQAVVETRANLGELRAIVRVLPIGFTLTLIITLLLYRLLTVGAARYAAKAYFQHGE